MSQVMSRLRVDATVVGYHVHLRVWDDHALAGKVILSMEGWRELASALAYSRINHEVRPDGKFRKE